MRAQAVGPRPSGLEEGGQPGRDLLALGDRRRDDDEREAQHGHEERGVDDEDRRAATERQPIADEADDRLERGRQQDRDEQQDEHAARRDGQRDQADDQRDAGGDARAADGPGGQIGAHTTTSVQPSWRGRSADTSPMVAVMATTAIRATSTTLRPIATAIHAPARTRRPATGGGPPRCRWAATIGAISGRVLTRTRAGTV